MRIATFVSLAVAAACCTGVGAVELTHRWSFNAADDYTDSVGGVVAAKMGTALQIADGQVKLTGTAAKSGSLDLGANLLDADGATIEIWARCQREREAALARSDGNYVPAGLRCETEAYGRQPRPVRRQTRRHHRHPLVLVYYSKV